MGSQRAGGGRGGGGSAIREVRRWVAGWGVGGGDAAVRVVRLSREHTGRGHAAWAPRPTATEGASRPVRAAVASPTCAVPSGAGQVSSLEAAACRPSPFRGGRHAAGRGVLAKARAPPPSTAPPPRGGGDRRQGRRKPCLQHRSSRGRPFPFTLCHTTCRNPRRFPLAQSRGGGGAGPAGQPIGLRSVMAVPAPDTPRQRPTRKKPTGGPSRGGPSRPRVAVQASSVEILQIFMGQGADPVHKKTITRFPGPTALGREAGPAPANRRPPQWRL